MSQSTNPFRAELRRHARASRQQLKDNLRLAHDESIRQHLIDLAHSKKMQSIAVYWPFDGEPDITPVAKQWVDADKEVALPVISIDEVPAMEFHRWGPTTVLRCNKYGIYEPQHSGKVQPASFDMVLIPLVAYDCNGNRIGMGSGYYDRHLEGIRDFPAPLRMGIAYSLQEIDTFETNDWDIPLHGVVNEHGWFTFST